MKNALCSRKKILIFIVLFLIFNVILFNFSKPVAYINIKNLGQYTELNFFYDNKSEQDYPFDDSHMVDHVFLQQNEKKSINLQVPLDNLNKFRIDFGTDPGTYEVYSISIKTSPLYEINISGEEFIRKFSNTNDINNYKVNNDIVEISTSGTDGHIYSLNFLEETSTNIRKDFVLNEIFIALLSLILIFISKIVLLIRRFLVLCINISNKSLYIVKLRRDKRGRILGFLIILSFSVVSSLLFDTVVLRMVAKASNFFGFDTLYRYFSPALSFSWGRVYFFFIFFFLASLLLFLGKKRAIRYRYVLAIMFFLLMVLGKFTGSSLGFYDGMLNGNAPNYSQSTLLGIPQGIRGDEWATEKPYYFAQMRSDFPYYNKNLSFDGNDMVISAFAPVKDFTILARPDLWGFLFLSHEYAFSFYWFLRITMLFMASFEMGLLLTKRYRYALFAAVVVTFAPPVQWWLSQTLMLMLMSGQFALVLFNKYLNTEKITVKTLSLLGVGFFALVYALTMYPATQVPLAYVFLSILIYIYIKNSDKKPLAPYRLVQYLLAVLPFAGVLFHFYNKSKPALHTMMNTIYPGSNRPWVKLPWDYDLYQFVNVFTASIRQPDFLNSSEISQFYSFAPFVILVVAFFVYHYRREALLPILLCSSIAILWIVSWLPQIPILNKITGLSFTYPIRITYAYGFGFTLLIITLLPMLEKRMKGLYSARNASIIAGTICFLTLCTLTNSGNIFSYFKSFKTGTVMMILIVTLLSYMGYLLLRGGKKRVRLFAKLLMALSIGSTVMVNPITQGMDSMFEKTTMKKIREIETMDSGRWMVSGSPTISNLVSAQGVARTSGTYYYPDWKMMSIIDKGHKYVDLWNQFAHIDMRLTDNTLELSLFDHEKSSKVNGTNRIIYIPVETARELEVKYIFTMIPIPKSIVDKGEVTLLYKDTVDPWSIYRLNY